MRALIIVALLLAGCAKDHVVGLHVAVPDADAGCTWHARDGSVYNEGEAEDLACTP